MWIFRYWALFSLMDTRGFMMAHAIGSAHSNRLKRMTARFLPIKRNQAGVTAVEFALISPIFFLLVVGIIQISLAMLAQNLMEGATFAASRMGKTGYVATGQTREATILSVLSQRAGMLLDINKVTITSKVYQQFSQVGQPEPFIDANGNGIWDPGENYTDVNGNGQYDKDMGVAGLGNSAQVVVYTISYPWAVVPPMIARLMGTAGVLNLTARTVVQNEPY
jgi:Flp pilus assembly pilin Flp